MARVAHVRRRAAHALARVHSVAPEHQPSAALDAARREWAAMDPGEAARRRAVLVELLVSEARAAAEMNEKRLAA